MAWELGYGLQVPSQLTASGGLKLGGINVDAAQLHLHQRGTDAPPLPQEVACSHDLRKKGREKR